MDNLNVIRKKVSQARRQLWGQDDVSCEPSDEDVRKAIDVKELESRSFQDKAVEAEPMGEQTLEKRHAGIKQFHTRRIAYWVKHEWRDPLVLAQDGCTIIEGSHRLWAAKYKGMTEVDCVVAGS
jgi:hypothetical protein